MMTSPTRLRQREILDAQLTRCRRVDNPFTRGAAAPPRWLAVGGPGPLTGTLATSINFEAIVRERATAEAIIYGPPPAGGSTPGPPPAGGSTPAAWSTP